MTIDLNLYAIVNLIATSTVAILAWLVYRSAPGREENRRLAAFLASLTAVNLTTATMYLSTTPTMVYATGVLVWPLVVLVIPVQLRFIATFDAPFLAPLRSRGGDRFLNLLVVAAAVGGILSARANIHGVVSFEPLVAYRPVWGPAFDWALRTLAVVSVLAAVGAFWAWHRARPGSVRRRQMGWYAIAAIVYDVFAVVRLGFFWPLMTGSVREGEPLPQWILEVTLASGGVAGVLFSLMLAYAILQAQVFDIHLKIKWTLNRSTLAAMFIGVFFVVSVIAENWLTDRFGLALGGIAAGLLLFALAPLQRLADHIAEAAMPGVRNDKEYLDLRRSEVYLAAVEGAIMDGTISDRERDVLAALADKLRLTALETRRLERTLLGDVTGPSGTGT